jgi:hypothetical protein
VRLEARGEDRERERGKKERGQKKAIDHARDETGSIAKFGVPVRGRRLGWGRQKVRGNKGLGKQKVGETKGWG